MAAWPISHSFRMFSLDSLSGDRYWNEKNKQTASARLAESVLIRVKRASALLTIRLGGVAERAAASVHERLPATSASLAHGSSVVTTRTHYRRPYTRAHVQLQCTAAALRRNSRQASLTLSFTASGKPLRTSKIRPDIQHETGQK